ncbi:MAG: rhomboid family intramembrane serine protease [Candidatus Diapherotrites archaeon]|nr:rhomboid family intramembrane serine protease [Candidatus Diapherotrites archaeon]
MRAKRRSKTGKKPVASSLGGFASLFFRFKAAITLTALLAGSYLLLSSGSLFISVERMMPLSFTLSQPLNIITYMFVHVSPWHIAANILCAVLFAAIVELALSSADVFLIFLFSGTLSAIVFSFLHPSIGLVGGSAGATALLSSALVLDLRKALFGLAAIVLLLFASSFAISLSLSSAKESMQRENAELGRRQQQAVESGDSETAAAIAEQREISERQLQGFERSVDFSAQAKTDPFIHAYAAFFGIAYLFLFRREKFRRAMARNIALISSFKKRARRG